MVDEASKELNEAQLHALLDILTHEEVYAEILDFRHPGALREYGPPFEAKDGQPSSSPSLQALLSDFILNLPSLRNVSKDFWQSHVASVIEDFEAAELSESYDKGSLGIRKTLATAISALVEYPVRGVFAGFDEPDDGSKDRKYDTQNADDLQLAFKDFMHQIVYGDILDDMFQKTAKTDKLADHKPIVKAAHEFGLVNLASFMHYTLVLSPKGQSLLGLIDNANKLVPYTLIRQTFKIGNVASMINAMIKVVLAKMSMGSVTNWMGWTSDANEGMNLLQNIIWTVLQWEIRDFRSRASKIEKSKEAPKKDQLNALKAYLQKSREEHEMLRESSKINSMSIVHAILGTSDADTSLNEVQHRLAQDYLAIQLSIRDREQIINVLCRSQPDHLTDAVRSLVAAYEPMIRAVHNAVDLSATLYDFEVFLRDMIKVAKVPEQPRRGQPAQRPTVGDFVQLLKKHQGSSHKFMHQCAKNDKELTGWFHDYARTAASHFRRQKLQVSREKKGAVEERKPTHFTPNAGDLAEDLQTLYASLPPSKKEPIPPILDWHARHLEKLHNSSGARLRTVVTSPSTSSSSIAKLNSSSTPGSRTASPAPPLSRADSNSGTPTSKTGFFGYSSKTRPQAAAKTQLDASIAKPGPGAYLARWQGLLDATPITPAEQFGSVRSGGEASPVKANLGGSGPQSKDSSLATTGDSDGAEKASSGSSANGNSADGKTAAAKDDDEDDEEDVFHDVFERLNEVVISPEQKQRKDGQDANPADVSPVVEALLPAFRQLLGRRSCKW